MENTRNSHNMFGENMHTTFPITSTSAIVSRLPTGEDGEVLEPGIFRWLETQYLGPPRVEGIEDWSLNKRMRNRDKIRPERSSLIVTQKAAQFHEKYVKNYKHVAKYQHCFLVELLPPPQPIPKATQIQCYKGDSRLVLRLAIAEYHVTEQKPKISVLSRRYSISHST